MIGVMGKIRSIAVRGESYLTPRILAKTKILVKPVSVAKKILSLYASSDIDRLPAPSDVLEQLSSVFNGTKKYQLVDTFLAVRELFSKEAVKWDDYRVSLFVVDMFPVYSFLSNYSAVNVAGDGIYLANSEETRDLIDNALRGLTSQQREILISRLDSYLYGEGFEDEDDYLGEAKEVAYSRLCQEHTSISNGSCENTVCLSHRNDRDTVLRILVNSYFFTEILCKTRFGGRDLTRQYSSFVNELKSETLKTPFSVRPEILEKLVKLDPLSASEVLPKLVEQGKMRGYEMAGLLLEYMNKVPSMASYLFSTRLREVKRFHEALGREYLINVCDWSDSLPDEWYSRAIHAEMLYDIYDYAYSRRQKLTAQSDFNIAGF